MPNATIVSTDNATPLGNNSNNPFFVSITNNTATSVLFLPPPTPVISVTGASGNVANASAVATLPANASKTTWITGFEMTASGATGALIVNATVAGTVSGTLTYNFIFPAGVTTAATPLLVQFNPAIPGSAINTAIVVTLPAGGSGNTNAACVAHGFQL